jgi:heme/copper-type cytochrome/quinol oxidase subunit 3
MNHLAIITAFFLIASSAAVFFSNKAGREGHDDNDGRFYYLMTGLAGITYTLQNVILIVREVS